MATGEMYHDVPMDELLDDLFTYHAPTAEQVGMYARINDAARAFARVLLIECPTSPDLSAAIRLVREARMTANASIATKCAGAIPGVVKPWR